MNFKLGLILLILAVMMSSCETKIESGSDVIYLMKREFNNTYLKHFTFSQYISEYENDSLVNKTIWHEAYSFPNQIVIKCDSLNSGKGYIFKQDTLYVIEHNTLTQKLRDIHDLLVLGFDIYEQPFQITYDKLTEKGYDLSKVCDAKIEGRAAYCVGVEKESDPQNKFYIDKEHLCFVKMISSTHSRYDEAVFADYKMVKGNYIATKVMFYDKGKLIMTEEYFDMDFPDALDSQIFDYKLFKEAKW